MKTIHSRTISLSLVLLSMAVGCDRIRPDKEKDQDEGQPEGAAKDEAAQCDGESCLPDTGVLDADGQPRDPLSFTGDLLRLKSCELVEAAIEQKVIERLKLDAADAKERYLAYRKHNLKYYPVDMTGGGRVAGGDVAVANASASESASPTADAGASAGSAGGGAGPSEVSTTNTQVAGVDEADIVKADGERLYVVSRNRLQIVKSWPADKTAVEGSLPFFDEQVRDLVLDEKGRLLVIGDMLPEPLANYWSSPARTSVMEIDLSNPAKPAIAKRYTLPGRYHSLRRVGSSVRLVLRNDRYLYQSHFNWQVMSLLYSMSLSEEEFTARLGIELERNIAATKAKTLDYWLMRDQFTRSADGSTAVLPTPATCDQVYLPTAPTDLGLTTVATLELDSGAVDLAQILTEANTVYASESSLYFTTAYWWWRQAADQKDYTYIHKFDITDPKVAVYAGSGKVDGSVLNQFAMDEHKGYLRVATTVTERIAATQAVEAPFWWRPFTNKTYSHVNVLGLEAGKLAVTGTTETIGEGERIFSVRFDGDKGYVVTFRQIDPLFTLDLSDPKAPRVVGELKIDGVSTYIHLMDSDHLLTVGRGDGWNTMRITIFDVKDPAHPAEAHRLDLPGQSSQAQYDHKAFTYMASRGLLALPVAGYTREPGNVDRWWSSYRSAVMVFKVTAEDGIKSLGELGMNDIYRGDNHGWWWWYGHAYAKRAVIADDFVYAVSDFGVRAANINTLDEVVATAPFLTAVP